MCLHEVYQGTQKKEALAKLPESGYYWKAVNKQKGNYYPHMQALPNNRPFKKGWNTTKPKYIGEGYKIAFHLHRTKKGAKGWSANSFIRCVVEKKDIVAIGTQCGLTIVATRIWIPKPK